ncbi:MAG: carboxypeptidase regulatory-like domain-containing protein [Planctomycetes bacterium]|nr:carboxypeptidase regulatory-like domain-containing protein [Planctomycetota bacterium]
MSFVLHRCAAVLLACAPQFGLVPAARSQALATTLPDDPFAAVAAMPAEPPVAGGLEVVVHDADGAPAKDAIVVLLASARGSYGERRDAAELRYPGDEPRILAARAIEGTRYAVSADGATRVPLDVRGRIVAVQGELVASVIRDAVGAAGGRRVTLQLLPAQTLSVEVVTADGGAAAGVPVGLLAAPDQMPFPQQSTGPDGKARFRVVAGRGEQAIVRALIAADAPPNDQLPSGDGATARLVLPACGSVMATLKFALLPGADVEWRLRNEHGVVARPSATPRPGQAVFEHVAAGFAGVLDCQVDGDAFGPEEGDGTPIAALAAGERREVEVTAGSDQQDLVVQLLQPDGQPVRSSWVMWQWQSGNGSTSSGGRTNREGWLRLAVDESRGAPGKLRLEARGGTWSGPLLGAASLELGELKAPRHVLEPQRLAAPTIALTGRVVTADGRVPAGLMLEARRDDDHTSYEVPIDAAGRFNVTMVEPHPQRVAVTLDTDQWSFVDNPGQPQFCDRGGEVLLQVQRCGRVRFHADPLPDGVHSTFDCYWLRAEDRVRVDVDLSDDAEVLTAPPGNWSLVIGYGETEIHRIDDITVASGIETHDARLMFFDWNAFAAVVSIRVQDEQGQPTDACTVWYHYQNGATGTSPNDGLSRWLVPKSGAHMTVEPDDDHAEVDLGMVDGGELVVRYGKGPRLLVALTGAPALPDGVTLVAAAEGQDVWQPFAADGTAELWAESVGGCRPRLAVRKGEQRVEVQFRLPRTELPRGGARLDVPAAEALGKAIEVALGGLR